MALEAILKLALVQSAMRALGVGGGIFITAGQTIPSSVQNAQKKDGGSKNLKRTGPSTSSWKGLHLRRFKAFLTLHNDMEIFPNTKNNEVR